jgi:hypothetical protein
MAEVVATGPELDMIAVAQAACDVTGTNDIGYTADDVAVVMQGWSRPADKHNVVRRLLDVQKYADRLSRHDHVVHDAKPEFGIEARGLLNVRRGDLVVVEAQRAAAAQVSNLWSSRSARVIVE